MLEQELSKEQMEKIEDLKQQWLDEAEVYLKDDVSIVRHQHLDGENSEELARIQFEYIKKIQDIIKSTETQKTK